MDEAWCLRRDEGYGVCTDDVTDGSFAFSFPLEMKNIVSPGPYPAINCPLDS